MVTPTPLLLVKVISELRTLDSNKVKYTSQKKKWMRKQPEKVTPFLKSFLSLNFLNQIEPCVL